MEILYVEDNPVDADLLQRALRKQIRDCALEIASTIQIAMERLAGAKAYDVVLTDLHLPDGSGIDLLAHIRERRLPTAVIILTGFGDQYSAVSALKAGADDYLIKRSDYLTRLPQTLTAALERFRALSARRAHTLRVLYVEGNPFDADLTRRHFAQHAPHVNLEIVASAGEALARLPASVAAQPAHDVVLLEYHLPGLDTLEVAKTLRNERGLVLPLVLITDQGSEEVAIQALRLGVDDYLTKHPGYLFELSAVLEKVYHQSELLREQAALRKSEARLMAMFNNSLDAILIATDDARFTDANPAACALFGYSQEEFTSLAISDLTPFPNRHRVQSMWRDFVSKGLQTGEYQVLRKDGSLVMTEYRAVANFIPGLHLAVFQDVSERKKNEARLRQWATVFESTRDGVMITDLDGHILTVNRAFTEITGYTEAEVIDRNPNLLRSGRHDRAFFRSLWSDLLETGHWRGEIWNRRKSGEVYPEWLTLNTVRTPQGKATHYVGVFTDISQLKQSEARLERLAHYDPLTELPNRLLVRSRLDHALEQAQRQGNLVGVLFVDLDRFKMVNDSLGHPAGDELLVAVAQRMRARLRGMDTVARLGGDEFLVVLENLTHAEDAAGVAQALILTLEQSFVLSSGKEVYIGASIGISLFPSDGTNAAELIRNADTALYQAKDQGRRTYWFYTEALTRAAHERLELEHRLHRALEQNEFILHYQPLIDLASGLIIGAEALVRWQPPGEALITPDHFITVMEETGLIISLGEWVLRTACMQVRAWMDAGLGSFMIAVNLATRQFRHRDIVGQVVAALAETGLPPECLELEITESGIMEQGERSEIILQALKETGVRLAIDDFGTGYSSLAYLKRFPINKLKIDRSFVRDIPMDRNDMEIAATIIAMARNLHLEVLAEGVETPAQRDFLRTQGCDSYQGYLYSPPMPGDAFAKRFLRMS